MSLKRGKGQVTIFVVVAILIVAAVVVFAVIKPGFVKPIVSKEEAEKIVSTQLQPIKELQEKCIKQTSMVFFDRIGAQAGYYDYSTFQTVNFAGDKVIVAYKTNGQWNNELAGIDKVRDEFDAFMKTEGYGLVDACTKNFADAKKVLDDVVYDKNTRKISAEVHNEDVTIVPDWPLTVKRGDAISVIEPSNSTILIPLGRILWVASDVIKIETVDGKDFSGGTYDNYFSVYQNPKSPPYGRAFKIDVQRPNYENNQKIYYVHSTPYRLNEKEFYFYFVIDFN